MNHKNSYLISEETYLKHIHEKLHLYVMLKHLTFAVRKIPVNRSSKELTCLASRFEQTCTELFSRWNIPESYLLLREKNDLYDLMEQELTDPEDAGYVLCDGDCDECCPCCGGECCCDDTEDDRESENAESDDETPDLGELLTMLGEVMHELFGDKVTVRIVSE